MVPTSQIQDDDERLLRDTALAMTAGRQHSQVIALLLAELDPAAYGHLPGDGPAAAAAWLARRLASLGVETRVLKLDGHNRAAVSLADVEAALEARLALASIAELTDATGIPRANAWRRMQAPGAPPSTPILNGKASVYWKQDGVAFLAGQKKEGPWRPPPQNIGGLADLVQATGKSKANLWAKLDRHGGHVQLHCGRVWRDFDAVLAAVAVIQPAGRKRRAQASVTIPAANGWERVADQYGVTGQWRKSLPDGSRLAVTRGERPGTSWNWARYAPQDAGGALVAGGGGGRSLRAARKAADLDAASVPAG